MKTKLLLITALLLTLGLTANAMAGNSRAPGFAYMTPDEVKTSLQQHQPMHLVDIQVQEEFAAHHLPGALNTCAYPVKSDTDKAKLAAFVDELKQDDSPVVVVCPRGAGGAQRAVSYLKASGIGEDRLFILEHGQQGWPHPEMIEKN